MWFFLTAKQQISNLIIPSHGGRHRKSMKMDTKILFFILKLMYF